jgi:cell fate regulator YaaT (PSP1 superfamily)
MLVAQVQFRQAGKRYYFNPLNFTVDNNVYVVVETIRGVELGKVVGKLVEVDEKSLQNEIKPILRLATDNDISENEYNKGLEQEVLVATKAAIRKNQLDMKLLAAEHTLDRDRLVIYFESEGRVDFRQLVKDLSESFKTRIELRQVGSRDGAKFIGGIGPCGLITCCTTFIGEFDNVSIKMAKNQNLSLNPQKISGNCGKLLCCIKFENSVYEELRENMPDVGDRVETKDGKATVISINILRQTMKLHYEDGSFGQMALKDLKDAR